MVARRALLVILQLMLFYKVICFTAEFYMLHIPSIRSSSCSTNEHFNICGFLLDISPQSGLLWTSTRDLYLRKSSYPSFYRYGLEFSLSNPWHVILFGILLSGDIAVNPGPVTENNSNIYVTTSSSSEVPTCKSDMSCLHFNARSLKSLICTSDGSVESNLSRFQDLVYSEDLDVVFVSETWLNERVFDGEVLPSGYEIFRSDRRQGRIGGGVLVAIKSEAFINTRLVYSSGNVNAGDLESVAVEVITSNNAKWLFICSYIDLQITATSPILNNYLIICA